MNKKEALNSLKITGGFFIVFGIIILIGSIVSWKFEETLFKHILNLGFGAGMCFFGWLILSSRKVLA